MLQFKILYHLSSLMKVSLGCTDMHEEVKRGEFFISWWQPVKAYIDNFWTWIIRNLKTTVWFWSDWCCFHAFKSCSHHHHLTSLYLFFRQYGLLLSFFQYCQHALDPDIEIDHAHFSTLRKEAQLILNLVSVF